MLTTVTGLVVQERDYGESNRFITIITEEYGAIDLSVKGAKKITGKNISSSQLFSYSKFCISEKNGRRYLNSSEPIRIFYGLRLDVKHLALACYIAEVAVYSMTGDKTGRDIMRLILNSLYLLETGKRGCDFIKAVFELRFTADMGHMPALIGCNECNKHETDEMFFLADKGILLCGEHFHFKGERQLVNNLNFKLNAGLLRALRHICLSPLDKIFGFTVSECTAKQLSVLSERYLLTHLSPPYTFKTLDYYNRLYI